MWPRLPTAFLYENISPPGDGMASTEKAAEHDRESLGNPNRRSVHHRTLRYRRGENLKGLAPPIWLSGPSYVELRRHQLDGNLDVIRPVVIARLACGNVQHQSDRQSIDSSTRNRQGNHEKEPRTQ
jgi:hypothetical protein